MSVLTKQAKYARLCQYGWHCFYCHIPLTLETATIDHVVPKSRKKGVHNNLRPACRACNFAKNNYTIEEWSRILFRQFFKFALPLWIKGMLSETPFSKMA